VVFKVDFNEKPIFATTLFLDARAVLKIWLWYVIS